MIDTNSSQIASSSKFADVMQILSGFLQFFHGRIEICGYVYC
jgi:hypothetical protein